ncbi:uncharacterized protein LOC133188038 [Saccostrea echinata]|uniref:uncharacterized protein LOC133188038 n=1 Tax=Saccostrea echinata TaxID=191078 RepID=UPI002A7FA383|nr:uncharacterized protein LOC133188038 [Saccostrea echinata]
MAEEGNEEISQLVIEDEESPIDLTTEKEPQIGQKYKGTKKFDKLNLSEAEIEERRRSANFMERRRMKKMSSALADLRRCIPQQYHLYHRRMSKIRTLRLAIAYIKALTDMLVKDDQRRQVMAMSQATFPALGMRLPHEPFSPLRSSMIIAAYAAHGAQSPRRQLMFSPDTRTKDIPRPFQTPETCQHPAYQTPVSHPLFGQSFVQNSISNKPAAKHTSDPEDNKEKSQSLLFAKYTAFPENPPRTLLHIGIPLESSCRYATELDGVCPLPEESDDAHGERL